MAASAPAADASTLLRLDGRVALVTGAAGGIGRAAAELFAGAGAAVGLLDIDGAAAASAAGAIEAKGGTARAYRLDVTDEAEVEAVFERACADLGSPGILLNNAGISIRRPSAELALADWNAVVAVNLTGAFLCARAAGRAMIAAGQGGAIVNTASIMSFSGGGLHPNLSYQSTKAAIVNLTRTLAVEWAEHGIRVNAVAPTWVRTPLVDHLAADPAAMARIRELTPLRRFAEPHEVAAAMLFLASSAAAMTTGHTLAVDGGYLAR